MREPEIVPEVVRKAFKFAQAEKPAAFIDSLRMWQICLGTSRIARQSPQMPEAPRGKARQVAELISTAENPVIIAGNGVIRHNAGDELVNFRR